MASNIVNKYYLLYLFHIRRKRVTTSFLVSLTLMIIILASIDTVFHKVFGNTNYENQIDVGLLPEAWFGILILVFGSLIIVISVAAQNVPEIISIYFRSWISLFFLWLIIFSSIHAIIINSVDQVSYANMVLNIYFLLPTSLILSIPYVFKVLQSIRPMTVINELELYFNKLNIEFQQLSLAKIAESEIIVSHYQSSIFEIINQLEDLFYYLKFPQPKRKILVVLCHIYREYIKNKKQFPNKFFLIGKEIESDICFVEADREFFDKICREQVFFERKIFFALKLISTDILKHSDHSSLSALIREISFILDEAVFEKDFLNLDLIRRNLNDITHLIIDNAFRGNDLIIYLRTMGYQHSIILKYIKLINKKEDFYIFEFLELTLCEIYENSHRGAGIDIGGHILFQTYTKAIQQSIENSENLYKKKMILDAKLDSTHRILEAMKKTDEYDFVEISLCSELLLLSLYLIKLNEIPLAEQIRSFYISNLGERDFEKKFVKDISFFKNMKGGDNFFSISSSDDSIFRKYPELLNQVDTLRNFLENGLRNH